MVSTDLAFLRNRLLSGCFDHRDQEMIARLVQLVVRGGGPFSSLMSGALSAALAHAEAGRLESAGREIGPIHNMPMEPGGVAGWDESHFLQFELPLYLDQDVSADRIRQVLLAIADALRAIGWD